jgi:hypothetical protein
VAWLRLCAMGYELVTVSEQLAGDTPKTVSTCYNSHPRGMDRYGHPLSLTNPLRELTDHRASAITP